MSILYPYLYNDVNLLFYIFKTDIYFREGPSCFFGDITFRIKKFMRRKLRALGLVKNRRVKLKETPQVKCSDSSRNNPSKDESLSDFEFAEDDFCT